MTLNPINIRKVIKKLLLVSLHNWAYNIFLVRPQQDFSWEYAFVNRRIKDAL